MLCSRSSSVRPVKFTARCSPVSTGRPGRTVNRTGRRTYAPLRPPRFFPLKPLPRRWPKRRRDAPVPREPLSWPGRAGRGQQRRTRTGASAPRPRPPGSGVRSRRRQLRTWLAAPFALSSAFCSGRVARESWFSLLGGLQSRGGRAAPARPGAVPVSRACSSGA